MEVRAGLEVIIRVPTLAPFEKNISSFPNFLLASDANHFYISEILSHSEGRCATSSTRDGDAMDAEGLLDAQRQGGRAKACGPDASRLASSRRLGRCR